MGTLENNEDPDEMSHHTVFHQGLYYFLQWKKYTIILQIITCDPSIYTMDLPNVTVSNVIKNYIGTQRVINVD